MASPKMLPRATMEYMNMHTKHELAKSILGRYLRGTKEQKTKILDGFCATTKCHRKHAVRKFKALQMTRHMKDSFAGKHARQRVRIYDSYVEPIAQNRKEFILPVFLFPQNTLMLSSRVAY